MKREELIDAVARDTGRPKAETEKILESLLNTMIQSFADGQPVELGKNFGRFDVRLREAGRLKNGGTLNQMGEGRTIVVFKATKDFKRIVNRKDEKAEIAKCGENAGAEDCTGLRKIEIC